jgi:hypothetical protein
MTDKEKLRKAKEFSRWIIANYVWQGGAPDGGEVQEVAEKLGIIEPEYATPDNRALWQHIDYCEVGDRFYVFADWVKPAPTGGQDE